MSMRALDIAASGLQTQSNAMGVISNNIANMQTTGFKGSRASFQDLMYANLGGASIGSGTGLSGTEIDLTQGNMMQTGQPLDAAISGNGFFRVADAQGSTFYTRAGNFTQDADGTLVLPGGTGSYIVQPPIRIPANATNVGIAANGSVTGQVDGSQQVFGQIGGASFANAEGLIQVGDNLFAASASSGPALPGQFGSGKLGVLASGYLEGSNVDLTTQMVNLLQTQQAFSASSVAFQTANEQFKQLETLNR